MDILDMLNHLKDAKINNSLSPEIFSKIVDYTNTLFFKSVMKNGISGEVIERYTANSPRNDASFAYNHKGLEDVYQKFSHNLTEIIKYGNQNKMDSVNSGFAKTK